MSKSARSEKTKGEDYMQLQIGENIRTNRQRLKLTQEELAQKLGVSFQSVSRWENGITYPDIELLPMLAMLFGIVTEVRPVQP